MYTTFLMCSSVDGHLGCYHLLAVVKNAGYTECPILLFVSNGKQTQGYWEKAQKEFAAILDAKIINFDCGHYIHHFKSDEMCKEIFKFVNSLER